MNIIEKVKIDIVKKINDILETDSLEASMITYPPNAELGDLALPCFALAKQLKKSPPEIASELMTQLSGQFDFISSIITTGPYLNFKIKQSYLSEQVINKIKNKPAEFGQNKQGEQKKVMVEYSNVNTHKEYHIGHLRNLSYGDAVYRVLVANGYHVYPVSYVNDFGIHVAKTLWNYSLSKADWDKKLAENGGKLFGDIYVDACAKEKSDKTAKGMIEGFMKKIEGREGEEYALWQETREQCIEYFAEIYKELDIKFTHHYYESEYIDAGRALVNKLLKQGILKTSEGAVIADLEKYNLGVLVILRSDGTATYPVADIPLAEAKFNDFQLDTSIYVVDNRQKLYFKQLFKILELMGYKQEKIHLEYDFVTLPEGAMSSRSGNTVPYESLKLALFDKALAETKERHSDWSEEELHKTAWIITAGAMKFEMLKVRADQIITFEIDKALNFQGYTAAYIQYASVRINSIIAKSEFDLNRSEFDISQLQEEKERLLVLKLAKYEDIVSQAGKAFNPSEITKYLFELTQDFNDYYHQVNILKADSGVKLARLALISAVRQVIENGFQILGIGLPERM